MIRKYSSIAKRAILRSCKAIRKSSFFIAILEWIYPPFCQLCKEKTSLRLFCLECWNTCKFAPIEDPAIEVLRKENFQKVFSKWVSYSVFRLSVFHQTPASMCLVSIDPNITASFVMFFWNLKDLPLPDFIACTRETKSITKCLSLRLNIPMLVVDRFLDVDCKKNDCKIFYFFSWEFIEEDFNCGPPSYEIHGNQKIFCLSLFRV